MNLTIITRTTMALVVLGSISASQAQRFDDSSTGNRYLNGRAVIPLNNQERETPQVNNNTYVNQSIASKIFQVSAGDVDIQCPGGSTVISGGGYCSTAIEASEIRGNGWHIQCDSGSSNNYNVFAMCAWND